MGKTDALAPEVVVFDAYGTLFDVDHAARVHAGSLVGKAPAVSATWRAKQLEYTWFHASRGSHAPFIDLTRDALLYALSLHGIGDDVAHRVMESYRSLAPFPEVAASLRELQSAGVHLAILSNADGDMLKDLVVAAGFDELFDDLLSVASAGTFKPAPAVYAFAINVLGVPVSKMQFVSSNRWDAAGAKMSGFHTVWINRTSRPDEYLQHKPDQTLSDFRDLTARKADG